MQEEQGQDGNQHQQPAELREEEELHGSVHTVLVSPYGDQEIHRDQHQLPREVEQEEIDSEKHAGDTGEYPEQVQVEEAGGLRDFVPGSQHGEDAQEEREHQEQEAQAIEGKVKTDAELRDPRPIGLREPGMKARVEIAYPQRQREDEIDQHGDQCDPASGRGAPARHHPRQDAGDQRNQDEPEQNHKNITIATNATAPPAIHAAYQRSLPVSVRLRTR